jgi:hypothetical protein
VTAVASFSLSAYAYPRYTCIEIAADYWAAGVGSYWVECSDDNRHWTRLPGSAATPLPPGGTALFFDFCRPDTGTRWYRPRTNLAVGAGVACGAPPQTAGSTP